MCLQLRALNDSLRTSFTGGNVNLTATVNNLSPDTQLRIIQAVRGFDTFDDDNDPYGEHDFGSVEIEDETYFWKIDYYDKCLKRGSEDPTDPTKTVRVLTIMHASDY